MKMIFLLISAVVLLVSTAVVNPAAGHPAHRNLNTIIDLAEQYNRSLTQEYFVDDVSYLAEGKHKCQDKFFCKVNKILHHHEGFGRGMEEKALVRNLRVYIDGRNKNCTELLHNDTPTVVKKPVPILIDHLIQCIKSLNLSSNR